MFYSKKVTEMQKFSYFGLKRFGIVVMVSVAADKALLISLVEKYVPNYCSLMLI